MRKNKITVEKANSTLNFYLISGEAGRQYLFTQSYTPGVYQYFRNGRSENEIRSYRNWNRNPRLDKTVSKIPMYIHFIQRENALMEDYYNHRKEDLSYEAER